jgi:hypothetical protein
MQVNSKLFLMVELQSKDERRNMSRNKLYLIIIIACLFSCNNRPEISDRYKLLNDAMGDLIIVDSNGIYCVIDGDIVNYNFNNDFIIINQKPRDSFRNYYKDDFPTTYSEQKKLFSKFRLRQYWIIDKRNDSIYGPYNKNLFYTKRKELGVPDSIKFTIFP